MNQEISKRLKAIDRIFCVTHIQPLTTHEILCGLRRLRRKMRVAIMENGNAKFDKIFKRDEMVVADMESYIPDGVEVRMTVDPYPNVLTITINF